MPHRPIGVTSIFNIPNADSLSNFKDRHYRWLNARTTERFAEHQMSFMGRPGYTLANGKTTDGTAKLAEALGYPASMVDKGTNRIVNGEFVLAWIPLAEYDLRNKERMEVVNDRRRGFKEEFKAAVDELNTNDIKPVVAPIDELLERAEHSNREGSPFVGSSGKA